MTHIITGLCLRSEECIKVCPVDCIEPGEPMDKWPWNYIDPEVCIDCGLCVPVCPYNAIWPEAEVPDLLKGDIQPNYDYYKRQLPRRVHPKSDNTQSRKAPLRGVQRKGKI